MPDFEELEGSPIETWDTNRGGGVSATRRFLCAWNDRYEVLRAFLASGGAVYSHHPLASQVRALSGSVQPFTRAKMVDSGVAGRAAYNSAEVAIQYGVSKLDASGDLFSESIEPVVEMETLDHTKFRWKTGDAAKAKLLPNEAPARPRSSIDYVLTRYQMTSVPSYAFDYLNNVNAAPVVASAWGYTFPAGTLLFGEPDISRRVNLDLNAFGFDVSYRMTYNPNGWNRFFRPDIGDYDEMVNRETGEVYKPFPEANFEVLRSG
jgi:hypothetical protein